jgi:hypothetical protein
MLNLRHQTAAFPQRKHDAVRPSVRLDLAAEFQELGSGDDSNVVGAGAQTGETGGGGV